MQCNAIPSKNKEKWERIFPLMWGMYVNFTDDEENSNSREKTRKSGKSAYFYLCDLCVCIIIYKWAVICIIVAVSVYNQPSVIIQFQ